MAFDQLRALAEKTREAFEEYHAKYVSDISVDEIKAAYDVLKFALAKFNIAASPEVVIGLLDRIAELEARGKWPKTKKRAISVHDIVSEMKASYEDD